MSRPNNWPTRCDHCGEHLARSRGVVYGLWGGPVLVVCGSGCRDAWRAVQAMCAAAMAHKRGDAVTIN